MGKKLGRKIFCAKKIGVGIFLGPMSEFFLFKKNWVGNLIGLKKIGVGYLIGLDKI